MISKNYFPDTRLVLSITDSSAPLLSYSSPPPTHSRWYPQCNGKLKCWCILFFDFSLILFVSLRWMVMMLSVFERSWKIYLPLWQLSCIFLIEIKPVIYETELDVNNCSSHNGRTHNSEDFVTNCTNWNDNKILGRQMFSLSRVDLCLGIVAQ